MNGLLAVKELVFSLLVEKFCRSRRRLFVLKTLLNREFNLAYCLPSSTPSFLSCLQEPPARTFIKRTL